MPEQSLTSPQEIARDPIVISEADAISIEQALEIARSENAPLGKSTLQRWSLKWYELHDKSPVKCTVYFAGNLKSYVLNREEFKVWLFDRGQTLRSNETLRGPDTLHEVSKGPQRPRETSAHFGERADDAKLDDDSAELQKELMNLKIDLAVRKQLLERAMDEIKQERMRSEVLLRENGALEFRLQQLPPARSWTVQEQDRTADQSRTSNRDVAGEAGEILRDGEADVPLN